MNPRDKAIAEAQAALAEAQKALDLAKALPENDSPVFCLGDGYSNYYYIRNIGGNPEYCGEILNASARHKGVAFRTAKAAKDFAEAFQVMLELRAQLGATPHTINNNWAVGVEWIGTVRPFRVSATSYFSLGGCFKTKEHVQAAIKNVGEDRIRKAAYTLAGMKE